MLADELHHVIRFGGFRVSACRGYRSAGCLSDRDDVPERDHDARRVVLAHLSERAVLLVVSDRDGSLAARLRLSVAADLPPAVEMR